MYNTTNGKHNLTRKEKYDADLYVSFTEKQDLWTQLLLLPIMDLTPIPIPTSVLLNLFLIYHMYFISLFNYYYSLSY